MEKENKVKNFIKKNKIMVAGVMVLLFIIFIVIFAIIINNDTKTVNNKKEGKIVVNTNEGIIKNEEYENLKFSNFTLIKNKDGISTLSADVTNTSDKVVDIKQVNIPIKDKKGKTLATLLGYIGKELNPNETVTITASTGVDLSKAKSKEITEYKKE